MKTCTKCKINQDQSMFTKDRRTNDGLDYKCKTCKAEIYSKIDKTERTQWRRSYYEAHLEHELKLCAVYREINRVPRNKYIAEYYQLYPHKAAAKAAKYRTAKLMATPKWLTPQQLLEIEEIYENCPKGYEVDHIIPIQGKQVRGLHVPWNLQYLLAIENKQKSNRTNYHECLTPVLKRTG